MEMSLQHELIASLQHSAAGWLLFDPQEQLRAANDAGRDAFSVALGGAPTWEQMMRDCHRHRRGLLIDTDDIDAWIARVRQSHRRHLPRQTVRLCSSPKSCCRAAAAWGPARFLVRCG